MRLSSLFCLLIAGLSTPSLHAQNLLLNGGHEDYTPAPSNSDPSDFCFRELYPPGPPPGPNVPLNPPGIASASASPDHLCFFPRSGVAHGGFFHWVESKFENPQYLLCEPLQPGESYEVEAWLRLSPQSGVACDQIGFWFTDWGFYEPGGQIFATPDHRTEAGLFFDQQTYIPITFTWTPNGAADALVIGNFRDAALPEGSQRIKLPSGGGEFAYYFLDDLRVRPIPRLVGPDSLCAGAFAVLTLANRPACSEPPIARWEVHSGDSLYTGAGDTLVFTALGPADIRVFLPEDTLSLSLPVRTEQEPPAWPDQRYLCPGDTLILDASFQGLAEGHQWTGGESTFAITVAQSGLYGVRFELQGCSYALETEVLSLPEWIPPVWEDTFRICPGDTLTFSGQPQPPYRFTVQGSPVADTFSLSQTGRFLIGVEPTPCGVAWTDTLDILLPFTPDEQGLRIPNVFTPNNDGTNDLFRIGETSGLLAYRMQVFNRWGTEVFRSEDPGQGWDGRYKDKEMPSDVYGWLLSAELMICGERQVRVLRGDLTLLR